MIFTIPVLNVVVRPEFLKVFERGANDGEAFGPHTFREEGGDTNEAVAGDAIGGTSGFEFVGRGKGEEGIGGGFNGVKEGNGDTVVNDLESPPSTEGIANEMRGVRERKVNEREGVGERDEIIIINIEGRRERIGLNPIIGIREFMKRVKVEVFVGGDVDRVGFEDFGYFDASHVFVCCVF